MADLVVQLSSGHEVEDEDDAVLLLVHFVDVDDAGVVQSDKHVHLVAGLDHAGLVDLGCEDLLGISADDSPHCRLGTIYLWFGLRPKISFSS